MICGRDATDHRFSDEETRRVGLEELHTPLGPVRRQTVPPEEPTGCANVVGLIPCAGQHSAMYLDLGGLRACETYRYARALLKVAAELR